MITISLSHRAHRRRMLTDVLGVAREMAATLLFARIDEGCERTWILRIPCWTR